MLSAHWSLATGTHWFLRRSRHGTEQLAICSQLGVCAHFTFLPESLLGGQLWHMDEAHMRLDPASMVLEGLGEPGSHIKVPMLMRFPLLVVFHSDSF